MRGVGNCSEPTKSHRWAILAERENCLQHFSEKKCCQNWKKMVKRFFSQPRVKVESTIENAKNTSNTGSKNYVWLLVRKIHGITAETQMLSVEAVWVMPSVTGCHTLSAPICKAKHNISDRGTSRYTFAASCKGEKPEEKKMDSTKNLFKIFHD